MYLNKAHFRRRLARRRSGLPRLLRKIRVRASRRRGGPARRPHPPPSTYAPTVNMDRAIARRNIVLQTMVASGSIDPVTAEQAKAAPVKLSNALEIKETFGLYFKAGAPRAGRAIRVAARLPRRASRLYHARRGSPARGGDDARDGLIDIDGGRASSMRSAPGEGRNRRRGRLPRAR